ncbi:hypothetical protein [Halorientalis sp. IM1011]|uniref:hypothetical protein n=1 Tax=Halorientalis sp. IM1011 TaxID=1932360 RepID=UPI0012F9D506|nr:hypothetical protein [Halorientalis sp. IM1011]
MAQTTVGFITTEHASSNRDPSAHADYVLDKWATDIQDGSRNYSLGVNSWDDRTAELNNPDGTDDALEQLKNDSTVQNIINETPVWDAVVVIDDRDYQFAVGGEVTEIGCAGPWNGEDAIAYMTADGEKIHTAHEVGHLHNARHGDAENWGWWEFTIMAQTNVQTCNNNDLQLTRKGRFSGCATNKIRDYIDNQM